MRINTILKDANIKEVLWKIVNSKMRGYQSDFDIDIKFLSDPARLNKTMLWFCRDLGTHLLQVDQLILRGTREYNTLMYYADTKTEIHATYIVCPKYIKDDVVFGDLKKVDFVQEVDSIKKNAVIPTSISYLTAEDDARKTIYLAPYDDVEKQFNFIARQNIGLRDIEVHGDDEWKYMTRYSPELNIV